MARRKKKIWVQELKPPYLPWLVVAAVSLVSVSIMLNGNRDLQKYTNSLSLKGKDGNQAWIEFDFGKNKKRQFVGEFTEAYPIYAVLQNATRKGKINFKYRNGKIQSVDGQKGNWRIFRNHKLIKTDLDGLIIGAGDNYLFSLSR